MKIFTIFECGVLDSELSEEVSGFRWMKWRETPGVQCGKRILFV